MAVPSQRYIKALNRNLAELQKALLAQTTLLAIESLPRVSTTFTHVVEFALFNDYVSHAIKVFDRNAKSSTFWYLYRTDSSPIDSFARSKGFNIANLGVVSDKLKAIRDGTHFHIDERGVLDPDTVWEGADLKGKELGAAIDFVWDALRQIQVRLGLQETTLLGYSFEEARSALLRVEGGSS